jgi:SAM-dependent methyltransferase
VYAERSEEPALEDCYFYHTMDVPGRGLIAGEWDLRTGVDTYLGHEDVAGKRVLELGTASGFLCFEMERRGAEVVAHDLNPAGAWDIVPFAGFDMPAIAADRAAHIAKINNSWWLCRRAFGSVARVVYGSVYEIPTDIGAFDLCTFGAILTHLRDPLRALHSAAALRPKTIIVTEMERRKWFGFMPEGGFARRSAYFVPDAATKSPIETWWAFSPEAISNLLAIVGYRTTRVVRHRQSFHGSMLPMFTVVATLNEARA